MDRKVARAAATERRSNTVTRVSCDTTRSGIWVGGVVEGLVQQY
jgi:hypothetical protein